VFRVASIDSSEIVQSWRRRGDRVRCSALAIQCHHTQRGVSIHEGHEPGRNRDTSRNICREHDLSRRLKIRRCAQLRGRFRRLLPARNCDRQLRRRTSRETGIRVVRSCESMRSRAAKGRTENGRSGCVERLSGQFCADVDVAWQWHGAGRGQLSRQSSD
jgi:hypothetical protein